MPSAPALVAARDEPIANNSNRPSHRRTIAAGQRGVGNAVSQQGTRYYTHGAGSQLLAARLLRIRRRHRRADGRSTAVHGKERDAETEQHYFGARYYRSTLGRFTSVDPHSIATDASSAAEFVAFLSNPQSWNRYAYVQNRPLVLTDPDGRCPTCGAVLLAPLAPVAAPAILTGAAVTTVVIAAGAIYENREAIGRSIGNFFDSIGNALGLSQSSAEAGDKAGAQAGTPSIKYPGSDPTKAPEGFEWRGRPGSKPGDKEGGFYNPRSGESIRPNLETTLSRSVPIGTSSTRTVRNGASSLMAPSSRRNNEVWLWRQDQTTGDDEAKSGIYLIAYSCSETTHRRARTGTMTR